MTKTQPSQSVTFEQLSQTLALLGFEMHNALEFTLFRNADFDAVIILPREGTSSDVRRIHLAAARATVVGKGVAAPADFDRLLVQSGHTPAHQEGPHAAGEPIRAIPSQTGAAAVPRRKAGKKAKLQAA